MLILIPATRLHHSRFAHSVLPAGDADLTDEKEKWIDDRAQQIIDMMPKEPSGLFHFSVPIDASPYEGLRSDKAGEAYNDFISAVAYAQAEYDWEHRTGCPF
ncbi:host nuclease inhibitor GamL [Escherichia coli]